MSSPIVCNSAKATIGKEHHLRVPLISARRPGVREDYRLPCSPVSIKQVCAVMSFEHTHIFLIPSGRCSRFKCLRPYGFMVLSKSERDLDYSLMKASRSGLMTSGCEIGIPWGKPG